jgi:hypothetical protein
MKNGYILSVIIELINLSSLVLVMVSVALAALMLLSGCSKDYERTRPLPRICKELGKECR